MCVCKCEDVWGLMCVIVGLCVSRCVCVWECGHALNPVGVSEHVGFSAHMIMSVCESDVFVCSCLDLSVRV